MHIQHHQTPSTSVTEVLKVTTTLVTAHMSVILGAPLDTKSATVRDVYCDMLLSGTKTMTRSAFLDAVNEAGGSIAVTEQEGRVTITLETIASRLPKILFLVTKMLTEPAFTKKELTRACKSLKNQYVLETEQARAMAYAQLTRALYTPTDSMYRYTPTEQAAVLDTVTPADLVQLHAAVRCAHWYITVGGNKKTNRAVVHCLQTIRDAAKTSVPPPPARQQTPRKHSARFVTHQISAQQNLEVSIGHRLSLSLTDPDYPTLVFALAVLGRWGGFAGRLMNTVREKEGLTYGIYCRAESPDSTSNGHWRIMTFFHPKDVEQGITSVLREIRLLTAKGITRNELIRFKTILATNHTLLFDSLLALTNSVHNFHSKQLQFTDYEAMLAQMQTLTVPEVNRVIKTYLHPEALTYAVAGNISGASSQLKRLRSSLKL